ncbi:MAG TPA: F390 synthetase-related protein, partial [Thermoanaerobaculia bacterium]|nr:F390 synthetase-related protein [Thermoanaerobaculia bacterium]
NFDTFNTRGVSFDDAMRVAMRADRATIDGITVGLSSGTSGRRGIFLVDRREQMIWAATIISRALPRLRRGLRVAFFLRSNSNLYQTLNRWVDFRYFDLVSPANLDDFQPHILVAPPSMLAKLTRARIRPERVISVAEVLEPQDETRLRDAFGVPVHQVYQCTEGLLAVSCAHNSLHIQEDLVALQFERAGEDEQPLTPIVTDLWRRTQPIIRYRLNDAVTLSPHACSCGSAFRVIERIEGRCDDACHFVKSDGTLRAFFPDALRRMVLVAGVDDYRIVQDAPGQLSIQATGDFSESALRASVAEGLSRDGCAMPELQIARGVPPVPPGEKRRRVVRS